MRRALLGIWLLSCTSAKSPVATVPPAPGPTPTRDVCGFVAPVSYGAPAPDGLVDVPPSDPNLRYVGRVDCSDRAAPAFAFPGVSLRARFEGDSLDLRLRDHGAGTPQSTNYYDVLIDDRPPLLVEASPARQVYELARGLGPGAHQVEIWKRTESGSGDAGRGDLLGLRVRQGTRLLPLPPRARRMEFIGDSITCGYGDELSTRDPDHAHFTSRNSNARLAFGAVAARALDADYVAVAYSGRGVIRNWDGFAGPTMPEMYLRILPETPAAPAWDPARFTPDVVVVNLGTNDFSPGELDRAAFARAYLSFVTRLRGYYPQAAIITAVGPMLSDFYPPGARAWSSIQELVQKAVAEREAAGDRRVYFIAFEPQTAPYGEDWHPTVATHQRMAEQLVTLVKRVQGW